ncbi:hypothetical protein RvY_08331 [Ramazzottius varieornatus]|uniref:Uncharacterized protein n=1 Tax=Ramazzottius varieornatus TaxID=947166 RepID=A0A1D1VB58_RAMVA|nr:hypothetical protein RvY_08331 [Ramazzottius varieornatus]
MATPDPKIPCPECGELYTSRGMSRHTGKTACETNQERNRRNNSAPSSQSVVAPADQLIATKPIHEGLQHLKASTKVIRRIPKGARMLEATSLTERKEDVLQKRSESSWRHLMLFSSAGLKQPDKDISKKGNLTTAVKNCEKHPKDAVLKKLVEGKINEGGICGALRVLSSEESVAVPTPEVLDTLRDTHPSESPDSLFPDPPDQLSLPEEVTVEEILAAVKSFPNGSAGGVDGLRPQHLKDMLSGAPNGGNGDASRSIG